MNKKGFTLTEILVVLVLLVSISLMSIIEVMSLQRRTEERRLDDLILEIEEATDVYINTNPELVKEILNSDVKECTRIFTLQYEGLLKNDLTNPVTGERIPTNLCVYSKAENGVIVSTFSLE